MASVTSTPTRISTVDNVNGADIGGGPGGAYDSNAIQNGVSYTRRQSGRSNHGVAIDAAGQNASASGTHVCFWHFHLNAADITNVRARVGSSASVYYEYNINVANQYPSTGGFWPVWLDLAGADSTAGTPNNASIGYCGMLLNIGTVTGNSNNIGIDAAQFTTDGYTLTGTAGTFADFITFEETATNRYGVLVSQAGLAVVYARLTLGSSGTSLVFDDSNFALAYPDQPKVSSTFMGLTCDLSNAATDITFTGGSIQSGNPAGATNRPDFIATGTAGTFSATGTAFSGLRALDATSAVTFTTCSFAQCGILTLSTGVLSGGSFSGSRSTAAVVAPDLSNISNVAFTKGANTSHAVEMTTAPAATQSWSCTDPDSSYQAGTAGTNVTTTNTGNEHIYINAASSQKVTISVQPGAVTPSVRKGASFTGQVDVLAGQATLTISNVVADSDVVIYAAGTTTKLQDDQDISGTTSTYTYTYSAGTFVDIKVYRDGYVPYFVYGLELGPSNANLPASQIIDRNYVP